MAPGLCSGPCQLCLRAAKWLPVVFIMAVVVWSYYAYVVQLNLLTVSNIFEKSFYLLVYHILLVLFLWSYWQTIFTEIGTVPKQFRLPPSELDRYEASETDEGRRQVLETFTQKQNLPIYNRTMMGEIRYCERCVQIKPDRCHHCSVCGVCVLKLDHHCPWVNNCVSFTNYKFFVLFLGYSLLYCLFISITTLQYFVLFWKNQLLVEGKFHILFVFFVSIMFAISLVSLFGYHVFLVLKNRSTLESFRAPIFRLNHAWVQDKDGFSLGTCNNFIEVFGEDRIKWFLPISTSLGDGVRYPVRGGGHNHHNHHHNPPTTTTTTTTSSTTTTTTTSPVQSYGSTHISLGDGVTYPQRCIEEDQNGLLGGHGRDTWNDDDDDDGGDGGREMTYSINTNSAFTNNHLQSNEEVIIRSSHTNPV